MQSNPLSSVNDAIRAVSQLQHPQSLAFMQTAAEMLAVQPRMASNWKFVDRTPVNPACLGQLNLRVPLTVSAAESSTRV